MNPNDGRYTSWDRALLGLVLMALALPVLLAVALANAIRGDN